VATLRDTIADLQNTVISLQITVDDSKLRIEELESALDSNAGWQVASASTAATAATSAAPAAGGWQLASVPAPAPGLGLVGLPGFPPGASTRLGVAVYPGGPPPGMLGVQPRVATEERPDPPGVLCRYWKNQSSPDCEAMPCNKF
jgi:hypothetical protein